MRHPALAHYSTGRLLSNPRAKAAINMAEAELKFGDDPEMKAMAQAIIDAQTREIEQLATWIEEHAQ